MSDKKIPKPEEIQKEFEDFIQKRFGKSVQVFAQEFPSSFMGDSKRDDESMDNTEIVSEDDSESLKLDLKPRDVKSHLDRFIIGQDEAKKALSIAVCDHYNQVFLHKKDPNGPDQEHYTKQNVLVLGPTGVGKTYMIRQIAKLIGVPFVKADATRFSETGYMGANVDDLIRDLVSQADGDVNLARYGIVYLDEADKLASAPNHQGRDVSGRGVQLGLLKLMEETDIDLKAANDPASQMQAFMEMQQKGKVEKQVVNTRHILFIVSGAFTGLEEFIGRRLNQKSIGFGQESKKNTDKYSLFNQASTEDFIKYGFEPEFVGRLPVRVACHPLDDQKLYEILKNSEGSIVRQYKQAFRSYGISLEFTDEALLEIAKLASSEETGARSLMTICEKIFRNYKYELPSTDVSELLVTRELILSPDDLLKELLSRAGAPDPKEYLDIRDFEEDFALTHGMKIKFNKEACELIAKFSKDKSQSIKEYCWELLVSYEHGLKLIRQNTGIEEFILESSVVLNPKQALEFMVKESYNHSRPTAQVAKEPGN